MRRGDRVSGCPTYGTDHREGSGACGGTVVYIHPRRRFYVLAFEFGDRRFCETFYFQAL